MSTQTKIQLSDFEKELLNNSEWILTKNNVIKKAQRLLGHVQENVSDYTDTNLNIFPPGVAAIPPKISKGENYLGLPWLILDYPRISSPERFFFIRSMFWWGHFFSSTLQVGGEYKKTVKVKLQDNLEGLSAKDYSIGVN